MSDLPTDLPSTLVQLIWSKDLDRFIERHLGRPWSLQQNAMLGQETLHFFEVFPDPKASDVVARWLASPPAQAPGRLNQPGFAESVDITTETILSELCNRGLLLEGDLRVHVWW